MTITHVVGKKLPESFSARLLASIRVLAAALIVDLPEFRGMQRNGHRLTARKAVGLADAMTSFQNTGLRCCGGRGTELCLRVQDFLLFHYCCTVSIIPQSSARSPLRRPLVLLNESK